MGVCSIDAFRRRWSNHANIPFNGSLLQVPLNLVREKRSSEIKGHSREKHQCHCRLFDLTVPADDHKWLFSSPIVLRFSKSCRLVLSIIYQKQNDKFCVTSATDFWELAWFLLFTRELNQYPCLAKKNEAKLLLLLRDVHRESNWAAASINACESIKTTRDIQRILILIKAISSICCHQLSRYIHFLPLFCQPHVHSPISTTKYWPSHFSNITL